MYQYSAVNTIVNNDANRNMLNTSTFYQDGFVSVKGGITETESDDITESACNL